MKATFFIRISDFFIPGVENLAAAKQLKKRIWIFTNLIMLALTALALIAFFYGYFDEKLYFPL